MSSDTDQSDDNHRQISSPALQEAPFGKIETHRIKSPMLEPTTQALDDAPEWMEPTTMANGESPQYLPLE